MSIDQDNVIQKAISMMAHDKFQRLIDDFIDRSSQEFGEMPASSRLDGRIYSPGRGMGFEGERVSICRGRV